MKISVNIFLCLCALCAEEPAQSQIDTTRKEFFPLHVGDLWQYRDEQDQISTMIVTSIDTQLANGYRYAVLDNREYPGFLTFNRVDSLLRVQQYLPFAGDTCGGAMNEYNLYRLGEPTNAVWHVCGDPAIGLCNESFMRFDGILIQSVFGQPREVMKFTPGCLRIGNPDTTWFLVQWLLARGIGILREETIENQYRYLAGTIINGVQYGTVVAVRGVPSTEPTAFILRQNYPNPFNSSTTIQYEIPERSLVRLTVYDVLGREVVNLVDRLQGSGRYQVKFEAEDMASGLYFCRLHVDEHVLINKMILQR